MKSRCTPTRWAPKSSAPATERQSTPLTPIAARRWRHVERERLAEPPGVDEEVAPSRSRAPISSSRSHSSAAVSKASRKNEPVPDHAGDQRRRRARPAAPPRSAARSGRPCRLPATSCAEPGSTRVISIRATARRNRTRAARSPGVKREACDPGEGAGGIEMPLSRTSYGEVVVPRKYHQSHGATSRHDAPGDPGARQGRPGTVAA